MDKLRKLVLPCGGMNDNKNSFICSGSAVGGCPAFPSNAINRHRKQKSWRYHNGKGFKDGIIKTSCSMHYDMDQYTNSATHIDLENFTKHLAHEEKMRAWRRKNILCCCRPLPCVCIAILAVLLLLGIGLLIYFYSKSSNLAESNIAEPDKVKDLSVSCSCLASSCPEMLTNSKFHSLLTLSSNNLG